jgi:hypothetical protein
MQTGQLVNRVGIAPRAGKIHRAKVTDSQSGHQGYSAVPIFLSKNSGAHCGCFDEFSIEYQDSTDNRRQVFTQSSFHMVRF